MNSSTVNVFKALANETRLKIVRRIHRAGEISCHELSRLFPLSQPTLSQHFNKLVGAKILTVRRAGAHNYYSLDRKTLDRHGIRITGGAKGVKERHGLGQGS